MQVSLVEISSRNTIFNHHDTPNKYQIVFKSRLCLFHDCDHTAGPLHVPAMDVTLIFQHVVKAEQ